MDPFETPGTSRRRTRSARHAVRLVVAVAIGTAPASAQFPELPTLRDAGLEYVSASGLLQVSLSGQLDLEGMHVGDSWAGLIDRSSAELPTPEASVACTRCHWEIAFPAEGGALGAHRLRILADVFVGDHVYARVEARSDRGHAPSDGPADTRVEQAFVALSAGRAEVQVGRFANPFGSYWLRHLTTDDPFVRPPIAHDYRTAMSRTLIPEDAHLFLNWRESTELFRKQGAPPIWSVPYQWGAMASAFVGPVDVRVAAMNSAPSSAPEAWAFEWDRFETPSWVLAARAQVIPELEVGASYNRGPWLEKPISGAVALPPGAPAGAEPASYLDFDQELVAVDFTFARGPMVLRAEAMLDQWNMPNVEGLPEERIYSAELQWDLAPGFFVATRVGHIDFRPVSDDLGAASPLPGGEVDWDFDVVRYEGSVGYRLSRNVGLLFSAFRQLQDERSDGDTTFAGVRFWWAF